MVEGLSNALGQGHKYAAQRDLKLVAIAPPNKSLDRSGGSVFLNFIGSEKIV